MHLSIYAVLRHCLCVCVCECVRALLSTLLASSLRPDVSGQRERESQCKRQVDPFGSGNQIHAHMQHTHTHAPMLSETCARCGQPPRRSAGRQPKDAHACVSRAHISTYVCPSEEKEQAGGRKGAHGDPRRWAYPRRTREKQRGRSDRASMRGDAAANPFKCVHSRIGSVPWRQQQEKNTKGHVKERERGRARRCAQVFSLSHKAKEDEPTDSL